MQSGYLQIEKDHKISGIRGLIEMLKKNAIETKDALKPNIAWLTTDIKIC